MMMLMVRKYMPLCFARLQESSSQITDAAAKPAPIIAHSTVCKMTAFSSFPIAPMSSGVTG